MRTKGKLNTIIIILLISLTVFFYFDKNDIVKTETVTITETKFDTIVKTIDNTKPNKIEKVYIQVPVDTIKIDTIEKVLYKDKEVNKYTYTDSTDVGILKSTIWADKIFKRNIELTLFEKTTTTLTTTTNTIVESNIFYGVQFGLNPVNGSIQDLSLNTYYVRKDKWLLNAGIGYNFQLANPVVNIGVAFKF